MRAIITLDEQTVRQLIREHVAKHSGVNKITEIRPKMEHTPHDERHVYVGHEIVVELTA